MSYTSTPGSGQGSRRPLAIVLAVIGVLFVILAILYLAAASSLPGFVQGASHHGQHPIRVAVSLVIAAACFVGTWLLMRSQPSAPQLRPLAGQSATGNVSGGSVRVVGTESGTASATSAPEAAESAIGAPVAPPATSPSASDAGPQ